MPYAHNGSVKIFYEVVGKGQPLVLQHGFTLDHTSWSEPNDNWVEALQNDYQLILIDARGHGKSDKLYQPKDYSLMKMASDVVSVLDDLRLKKTHFMGYSMGGEIGFAAACLAPERFHSFVLGGASGKDNLSEEPSGLLPIYKQGTQAVIEMIEGFFAGGMPPGLRNVLLANDYKALAAHVEWKQRNGLWDILPSIHVPCLIYAGDEDVVYQDAKQISEIMPNASFLTVSGDHFAPNVDNTGTQIKRFLQTVGQAVN